MPRKTFKKIIVSDELLKQVDPTNIKLRDKFLKEKGTRSSDKTIDNYLSDLNIFLVWNLLYNDNKIFVNVKKIDFSEFFAYSVDELKWGSARFARTKSCLSSFANFIEKFYDDEYPLFRNLVLRAVESMPRNAVREKTVLSEEQVDNLFKKLDDAGEYQISCWLALGIASGSRFSELLRFTTDIIDENNTAFEGLFLETTKAIKTKGRGKTGKLLKKYILKDLFLERYKKWLEQRQTILALKQKEHNFLFIKNDGDPAGESTARTWVEKIEKFLGCNYYPHSLRHFYTTKLSKIGIPHTLIKELVGWADVKMVEIYDDQEAKDRKWSELDKLREHLQK